MVAIREAPKAKEVPLPTTMKAAVLNSTGEAPVLTDDVAIPKLQGNQVLISLLASAVCHTDARLAAGDWTTYTTIETPKILGHQGVGKIIAGSLPNGFQMGERVGISWLNGQCAVCHLCISGHENLCSQLDPIGFRVNGTHAQFVIAEKNALVKIPDKVSSEMAAPIMCCGVTAYKAIKESKVRPGEILAIFGSGGTVGNLAIQYAEAMGIKTVAIDRGPVKMPHGAGTSITPIDITRAWPDVSSMIKKVCKQKSPQGALVLSHEHDFYSIALSCIEANGVVVAVALPADSKCDVDLFNLIMHGKTFKGSIVGTRLDLIEALDFVRDGKVVPEILLKSLDDLNDVLDAFDSHFAGDTAMPAKSVVLELK